MMNVKEALDLCDSILEDISDLPERAEEFADGVGSTISGIKETIELKQLVTENQVRAIDNMRSAVDKWMR